MVQAQARIFALLSNSALVRGKNIADSVTIDKLYIDDTVTPPTAGKPLSNMKMPPPGQFYSIFAISTSIREGAPQHNQINRTSTAPPLHSLQRIHAQNRSQAPVVGATRNVGVEHGDQNFPGTTFFLASISVVLEFLRLPWRFPDMLLCRNDMWQIDASDEADVFRWCNEIIMIQLFQKDRREKREEKKGDWSRMLEFSVNLSATLFYRSFTHMHEFCERATPPTATEGAGITGFPCQTSLLPYCRLNQRYKSDGQQILTGAAGSFRAAIVFTSTFQFIYSHAMNFVKEQLLPPATEGAGESHHFVNA
ncbi:hypothetical protein NC653_008077 [Populus alba x Populus x berolinensis]|uniref:Uncharacterized protein n=1 Tax=Populus alba x Populus x berolinensis TaxID=444605 RepID=A0AAD6R5W3_9ROSI|nr:hypothetical protein NC653_008077 [Populus alba x Populus x berolinensis]